MTGEPPALVLDNGTGFIKCGYAGENFPSCVVPTAVGRPMVRSKRHRGIHRVDAPQQSPHTTKLADVMYGEEATSNSEMLEMFYPIRNGVIQDMDVMEQLWRFIFSQQMQLDEASLTERRLLLSEVPLLSSQQRCKLYEVMFEQFGFAAIQSTVQGVLSLFSCGLQTGVVVECGEGISHCTPVYDGYALPKANRRLDLGGRDITLFLLRLLQRRGCSFRQQHDMEVVRRIKEKFCYTAVDGKLEKQLAYDTCALEETFTLPDGTSCSIGAERYEATEALFDPRLIDAESEGLSLQLWSSIQSTDIDLRASLCASVVLSGGTTMLPGLPTRIELDLQRLLLEQTLKGDASRLKRFPVRVDDPPRRRHMVFLGGAALAALSAGVEEMWVPKAVWEEEGPSALHARFGV